MFSGRPSSSTGTAPPQLLRRSMTWRMSTSGADAPAVTPTALTLAEQHYYAVSVLKGEVYNGGVEQYFGNSSADHYLIACAGLRTLGALHTLALLERLPIAMEREDLRVVHAAWRPQQIAMARELLPAFDAQAFLEEGALTVDAGRLFEQLILTLVALLELILQQAQFAFSEVYVGVPHAGIQTMKILQ